MMSINYLMHFNQYHDKLGRFARSPGGGSSSVYRRSKSISNEEMTAANVRMNQERKYRQNLKEDRLARRSRASALVDNGKNLSNDARTSTDAAANIARTLGNKARSKDSSAAKTASKMSDAELRSAINRMDMERRYVSLKQSEIRTGYDTAADVLSISGNVLAISAGALGVAASLKYLRG